jgi:hypothetical protein
LSFIPLSSDYEAEAMTDVVALAKKIVPDRWHPLAQRIRLAVHRTMPRYRAWRYEKWPVLQCQIVYNKLGGYCMPHSSADRVASQLLLRGHVYEPDTIEYIARHAKSGDVIDFSRVCAVLQNMGIRAGPRKLSLRAHYDSTQ